MRLAHLTVLVLPLGACALQRSPIIERDAATLDAPLADVPLPDGSTCDPTACNDGNPCTDDRCGASGCEHVPNVAPCDDGLFCTTEEQCSEGTCGGGRETCAFCDETANSCGACSTASDCPSPMVGTCVYADACATSGTSESTSFRCDAGTCVAQTESVACTRSTDGMACGATTVTRGTCTTTGMFCTRGGAVAVTTTSLVCGAGTCMNRSVVATEACDHDPTGDACRTCTDGACSVPTGFCTGSLTRSCGMGTCAGTGACVLGSSDTTMTVACNAATGTVCAASGSCGACTRNPTGPACGMDCRYTLGSCTGASCTGAGTEMMMRLPCMCP